VTTTKATRKTTTTKTSAATKRPASTPAKAQRRNVGAAPAAKRPQAKTPQAQRHEAAAIEAELEAMVEEAKANMVTITDVLARPVLAEELAKGLFRDALDNHFHVLGHDGGVGALESVNIDGQEYFDSWTSEMEDGQMDLDLDTFIMLLLIRRANLAKRTLLEEQDACDEYHASWPQSATIIAGTGPATKPVALGDRVTVVLQPGSRSKWNGFTGEIIKVNPTKYKVKSDEGLTLMVPKSLVVPV
jgi:hypothetical protein